MHPWLPTGSVCTQSHTLQISVWISLWNTQLISTRYISFGKLRGSMLVSMSQRVILRRAAAMLSAGRRNHQAFNEHLMHCVSHIVPLVSLTRIQAREDLRQFLYVPWKHCGVSHEVRCACVSRPSQDTKHNHIFPRRSFRNQPSRSNNCTRTIGTFSCHNLKLTSKKKEMLRLLSRSSRVCRH